MHTKIQLKRKTWIEVGKKEKEQWTKGNPKFQKANYIVQQQRNEKMSSVGDRIGYFKFIMISKIYSSDYKPA